MLKINFKAILNSMQPKKEGTGKSFIENLSFRLRLENLSYGVLLDVKKRVNVFLKKSLDRKEEETKLLCLQEIDITCNIDTCKFLYLVFLYTKGLQEHISLSKNTHAMKCLSIDQQVNWIINKLNNLIHLDKNIPMIIQIENILCIKSV
jgi:hypothetical protein